MTHKINHCRDGFTLVELMVTVAILSILLTLAVPTMRSIIANSYASGISNEFVAALNYARSEAVKRRTNIVMCTSSNGSTCRADGNSTNWHMGWVILNGAQVMRASAQLDGGATLTGPSSITYGSTGSALANTFQLRLTHCTRSNNRDVTVGVTGRIGVSRVAC